MNLKVKVQQCVNRCFALGYGAHKEKNRQLVEAATTEMAIFMIRKFFTIIQSCQSESFPKKERLKIQKQLNKLLAELNDTDDEES